MRRPLIEPTEARALVDLNQRRPVAVASIVRNQRERGQMPKIIVLPASGTGSDEAVFTTALAAAKLFDGHLSVLHVRPDVRRDIAAMASADMGMAAGLEMTIARMEADADARERLAEAAWRDFCGRNGIMLAEQPCADCVTYEWLSETGIASDWLA